jgi:NarL family two-component system response regulator LiaR
MATTTTDFEQITVLVAVPDTSERDRLLGSVAGSHEVIGTATTADEAVRLAVDCIPDVAILHERLGSEAIAEVCAELAAQTPATRVLLITSTDDESTYAALRNGLFSAVRSTSSADQVDDAVRATARGESLLLTSLASRLLDELGHTVEADQAGLDPAERSGRLTMTEREVLGRLASGDTPDEIARAHEVTARLVNLHAGYAVAKLHDHTRQARHLAGRV